MNKKRFFLVFCLLLMTLFFLLPYLSELSLSFSSLWPSFKKTEPFVLNRAITSLPRSKTGVTLAIDLNSVLFDVDTKQTLQEIGLSTILKYTNKHNIAFANVEPALTKKLYAIFNKVTDTAKQPFSIIHDWQTGIKSNTELKAFIIPLLEAHPEWFDSKIEKKIITQIINKMFTPTLLISTIKIASSALSFIKKCKQEGHTLLIFANWDPESFALLEQQFSSLFMLFDGIIISGHSKYTIPSPQAYAPLVARKKNLNETIICLSAQKPALDTAYAEHLQGILCKKKSSFLGLTSTTDFAEITAQLNHIIKNEPATS